MNILNEIKLLKKLSPQKRNSKKTIVDSRKKFPVKNMKVYSITEKNKLKDHLINFSYIIIIIVWN